VTGHRLRLLTASATPPTTHAPTTPGAGAPGGASGGGKYPPGIGASIDDATGTPGFTIAVIHARRLLLGAIDDMEAGRPVVGSGPGLDHRDVLPVDAILPGPAPEALARA